MVPPLDLTVVLEPQGPASAILLTDEQVAALGDGKRSFPVQVAINGHTLRLRLQRMGGRNMIGLSKSARTEAAVEVGASYDVSITPDDGERTVEVPADLAAALAADPAAEAAFAELAFSHRKEYVRWVTEAKQQATRDTRIAKAVEMVRAGQTR